MKSENYIKIEFPSRSVNEGFARAAAAAFAAQLDPTLEELGDIRTAVSEAVTNCIVHAYPDSIGRRASPSSRPAAPSAAAWALPSWRASRTSCASAPRRGGGPR